MKRGYGVIFMSREGSAAPFARRLQELVSPNVDLKLMDKLVLGGERAVQALPRNESLSSSCVREVLLFSSLASCFGPVLPHFFCF